MACRTVCGTIIIRFDFFFVKGTLSNYVDDDDGGCVQMGFAFGMYLFGAGGTLQGTTTLDTTYYSNVHCNGDEESLWHCDMDEGPDWTPSECDDLEAAVQLYCVRFS